MTILIKNIRSLLNNRTENILLKGRDLANLPSIDHSFLIVEDDIIAGFGPMNALKGSQASIPEQVDATGQFVLPCWCDSHTHLVYAASREDEFVDKIKGKSYTEIAARGGGILSSAKKIKEITEDELYNISMKRLKEVMRKGTGAIEIKSGYGLSVETELKMLRVIKRLKENSPAQVRSTFLGAHAFPQEYRNNHRGYIGKIIDEMLPRIAAEGLADFIDVFCETGFYSPEETEEICHAGMRYGLRPKIHANQLGLSGGVQTGLKLKALSVDHLEFMDDDLIKTLAGSSTIGTLLPTAAFFLGMPMPAARKMIEGGCAIAIASDYNPGSSPGGNMNLVISMSCIQMKMTPEEAINAATINGAFAMGVEAVAGSIMKGKKANLVFTKPIPSLAYMPYSFAENCIDKVMINGSFI
jgi:imidazolonepropionase